MTDFIPGYREDKEDIVKLVTFSMETPAFRIGDVRPITRRNWLRVRNQGRMGSCTGFSKAVLIQILNYVDTLDRDGTPESIEISAMHCYLTNQARCGLIGQDQGATISGALDASIYDGHVLESRYPYPDRYPSRVHIPEDIKDEALNHRLLRYLRPKSYEDVFAWHQTGMGATLIGVPWTRAMANSDGVFTRDDIRGASMGGHAMCLTGGHSETLVDRNNRPYLEVINSHGTQFGDNGYAYVEPECIDWWIANRSSEVICMTDVQEGFKPRRASTEWESAWGGFGFNGPGMEWEHAWQ